MENRDPNRPVEEIYQKKSQLEHILLRPDTYIGSIEAESDTRWLVQPRTGAFEFRQCSFVPGLFKIFDEILVNAADNKQRDASMSALRVDIDQASGSIAVHNNGRGIPVELHKEEGVYVPELIFGHLLTSSNYNDGEKKTVGGRNGYGAKLANIFSTQFAIETHDSNSGRSYHQRWSDNMQHKDKARITAGKAGGKDKDFTKVTFTPDYRRFGCDGLSDDMMGLMMRRVWDIAGTSGRSLSVYMNGQQLKCNTFSDYVSKFLAASTTPGTAAPPVNVCERINERWEVSVSLSADGHFNQLSWVNSIATSRGGTHIAYIQDQLVKAISEHMDKKHKKVKVKPALIKSHLCLFVNALIDNPSFDTQTKECLTLKRQQFGSTCELSEKFIKSVIAKTGLIDAIVDLAQFKESKELKKNDGKKSARITGIPKLDDANDAGTKNGHLCTLILTEGDSAKALAVSGLSVVGRDRYGIFPLRGKLLNVREASAKQIMDNAEVGAIKKILGLQQGRVYHDASGLRYGSVMIMTDQDHDGSHIKGLIINLFATFWPSLLQLSGFLTEFITPIVKVRNGRTKEELSFFTLPEYNTWRERQGGAAMTGWSIKYYKGLGTSTSQEAKEYFSGILRHRLEFKADPQSSAAIELAFGKSQADARKEWLAEWTLDTFLDQSKGTLTFSDFVHKELILFSVASNQRAIPSLVDGLKPGQRKILYACFLKRLTKEIKVAQLAGYVAEKSAYHHGEQALTATIVGMAQSFVGSNNINLLYPSGMFGTRLAGGKDAASARYIFTRLCPIARSLFPAADDSILNYLNDDGLDIEPDYYLPVLPLVLINGSSGIGTGWSSSIPNFDPRQIARCILRRLRGDGSDASVEELQPHYKGFTGVMAAAGAGRYQHSGRIERVDECSLLINELPVQVWTADYKLMLEEMTDKQEIRTYREYHTDTTVAFLVQLQSAAQMAEYEAAPGGLYKRFKLASSLSTSNMVLFDTQGRLRRYDSVAAIMDEFCAVRLDGYRRRKVEQVRRSEAELKRISNKCRFILAVVAEQIKIRGVKKADITSQLSQHGYDKMTKNDALSGAKRTSSEEAAEDDGEREGDDSAAAASASAAGYEYLLSMPLYSLTMEKVDELKRQKGDKEADLRTLLATSEAQMWTTDVEAVIAAIDQHEEEERSREEGEVAAVATGKAAKGKAGQKAAGKKAAVIPRGLLLPPPEPTKEKEGKERKPKAAKRANTDTANSVDGGDKKTAAVEGAANKRGRSKPAAASSGASKASSKYREEEEEEEEVDRSEDSGSDGDEWSQPQQTTRREARPARAAAVKPKKYVDEEEEVAEESEAEEQSEADDSDGEEEWEFDSYQRDDKKKNGVSASAVSSSRTVAKPAVVSKPAAVTKATKAAGARSQQRTAAAVVSDDDDDGGADVAEMSLADRLALRLNQVTLGGQPSAPPAVKAAAKRTISKAKAMAGEAGGKSKAAEKHTPDAKRQKAKPAVAVAAAQPRAVPAANSRQPRAAASKQQKYIEVSDSEEEYEMEDISDDDAGDDSDY